MNGFAQGLLTGFTTVDEAMQRRKETGLREAELALKQQSDERDHRLAQDQFAYQKETGERDHQYTRERNRVADEREARDFSLRRAEFVTRQGIVRRQLAMQKENHDFTLNNMRYEQRLKRHAPQTEMLQRAVQAGDYKSMQRIARDMPDDIPLARMVKDLTFARSQLDAGRELYNILSSPEYADNPAGALEAVNGGMHKIAPLFQVEAERAIGQTDPVTGQKIVGARVEKIMPVPGPEGYGDSGAADDAFAVYLKVKYADGREAVRPVTEQRSTDRRDTVKQVSLRDTMRGVGERVIAADNIIRHAVPPPGLSLTEKEKGLIKVAVAAARGGRDVDSEMAQYGGAVGLPEYQARAQQKQQVQVQEDGRKWAGGDPVKQMFVQDASAGAPELFTPGNEKLRDIYFENYKVKYENTQQTLRDAGASAHANQLRQQRQQQQTQPDFLYGSD